jgi:hypothetical protein
MDINTLIDDITTALSQDATLQAWAHDIYDRAAKIYTNIDIRNPPTGDDCPYIVVFPRGKVCGYYVKEQDHAIEVDCCITDESVRDRDDENIVEYLGVSRLETFRKYVETTIAGVDLDNGIIDEIHIEYNVMEFFPSMVAEMTIGIKKPVTLGVDPLS